jgi:hypothetical protein
VRELNDAPLWVTMDGVPEKIEVQIWLSAFNIPHDTIRKFGKDWSTQLQKIFS